MKLEVAKQRSFTKASEVLHVSQPSISKVVKDLEAELGASLLDRSYKQVELTDIGEIVFERAQMIVQSTNGLLDEIADLMQIKRGKISIGIPPMAGSRLFPKILGEFNEQYPGVTIELVEVGAKRVESLVINGEIDIGVVLFSEEQDPFQSFHFGGNSIALLVYENHPLAKQERIRLDDLQNERFIMFPEDFGLQQLIMHFCNEAGFQPYVVYRSSQWDFICQMVAARLGIALMPQTVCRELRSEQLRVIPLTPTISWKMSMIWRKDKYLSFAAREWIQFARQRL